MKAVSDVELELLPGQVNGPLRYDQAGFGDANAARYNAAMMFRLRRLILITGTFVSVLLLVAFVASGWWYFEVGIRGVAYIGIGSGAVDVWAPSDVRWFASCIRHERGLRGAMFAATQVNGFTVPIVFIFAAVAIPTMLVWRFGRKRVKLGLCQCGYDLTGNVSGVCPECGTGM